MIDMCDTALGANCIRRDRAEKDGTKQRYHSLIIQEKP